MKYALRRYLASRLAMRQPHLAVVTHICTKKPMAKSMSTMLVKFRLTDDTGTENAMQFTEMASWYIGKIRTEIGATMRVCYTGMIIEALDYLMW